MAFPAHLTLRTVFLLALGLLVLQALVLFSFGQPLVCECGSISLWNGDVRGPENSQQLSDWYTPSHVIHGFLFFWLLGWLFPRLPLGYRLLLALGIEIGWELLENTPMVIEHYRKQALAQGYVGDSIINSISDTLAMLTGFWIAKTVPLWLTLSFLVGLELFTLYFIRDNLTLNIINLIYPLTTISNWQAGLGT